MLFNIPKTELKARIFERVETVDDQYDIFDIGVQHPDGGIDSVVVGGSFYSVKTAIKNAEEDAALTHQAAVATAQCVTTPAVQGVVKHPVTNYDGAEQDIEGL